MGNQVTKPRLPPSPPVYVVKQRHPVVTFLRAVGFCLLILVGASINALLLNVLIDTWQDQLVKKQQVLMQPCSTGQAFNSSTGERCPKETK